MRIMALSALKSGWMNGEGEAISRTALDVALRLLKLSPDLRNEAGVFPTLEGGVQMEGEDFTIEVHPAGSIVVTDDLVEDEGTLFSHEAFTHSIRKVLNAIHPLAARGVDARKAPTTSEREDRLESILRRILPMSNTAGFNDCLRRDLAREFPNMRGSGGRLQETDFVITRTLMKYDGPILAMARAGNREALLMRLDEEEAGHYFSLVVPTAHVMRQLTEGEICLRQACLHETSDTYVCEEYIEGTMATILDGPLLECHLPLPDLSVRELIEEYEPCMDPS